ncbi:MAG: hypothetical protein ACHQ2Z_06755 [Elusimicrobiota bacterium]
MTNRLPLALLILAFVAPAQALDWTQDPVAQLRQNMAFKSVPAAAPSIAAGSPSNAPLRLDARLISARASAPSAPAHPHTIGSYMSVDRDSRRVEAIYSDCDDAIDDCSFLIYDFPQLKRAENGEALTYNGATVAVLTDGGARIALADGYRLSYRRLEDGESYRIEMFIEKASRQAGFTYHQGTLTLRGETRSVCFALSDKKVDSAAGDPDLSQGVYVSQAIPSFRERSAGSTVECAASLELNGDYVKTCRGLFLIGAASASRGDIFTQLERYGADGKLKLRPVGTFEFKRVDLCSN